MVEWSSTGKKHFVFNDKLHAGQYRESIPITDAIMKLYTHQSVLEKHL